MDKREAIVRPHLIKGSVRSLKQLQRKHIRYLMGHLRPIVCPTEGQYTPQIATSIHLDGVVERKCRLCNLHFTRADSRRFIKERKRGR